MKNERYDLAIVGAGIIGLAHAYHAARRGWRVIVIERGAKAQGASIRNFGMLWPIGQPAGDRYQLARRSLEIWREVLEQAEIWQDPCGSLHLAYADDEAAVLREFANAAPKVGFHCDWIGPDEVAVRSQVIQRANLQGALWSPVEVCVDPREVIRRLPEWLNQRLGVEFVQGVTVTDARPESLRGGGQSWRAHRILVCSGDDLLTLYPEEIGKLGLSRCKLQMMRTASTGSWKLGAMLAAGLTLRHYKSFEACPSLPALKERYAREMAEYDRLGIHVLASQNGRGELLIGDSHEYDDDIEPFDQAEIERLVLGYLATFLQPPNCTIASRWHGIYVKHPSEPWVIIKPTEGVTIVTGVGGAGMTLSFGLAERIIAAMT
jgi:FAD dependent oxidoreductase TIGR03364